MPTTKPDVLPTVEQAEQDLTTAEQRYDAAVRAVIAGNSKLTAKDVAEAQDAIEFAKLRLELAHKTSACTAEEQRVARIRELTALLGAGLAVSKGRRVVELETTAVQALDALFVAAADYHSTVRRAAVELSRLGELPSHVEVDSSQAVRVDGVLIHGTQNYGGWAGNVLCGAISRAVAPHSASLNERARDVANAASRALSGGIHQPRVTATQQLAEQLDRLTEREA